jgi:HD-like signal output (HDOD) protein
MGDDDSKTDRQVPPDNPKPLSDFLLIERINQCPKLASLKSINETLNDLLDSEDSFVAQIAEVIRLDPSLTTRVLDLVNSIFFGSKDEKRITGVEEASIFLGLNRIRELISATPIIEEIMDLGKNSQTFPWTDYWRHSIGTAILTREILALTDQQFEDEADYVAGLLHNLGKLILAITFPVLFEEIYQKKFERIGDFVEDPQRNRLRLRTAGPSRRGFLLLGLLFLCCGASNPSMGRFESFFPSPLFPR